MSSGGAAVCSDEAPSVSVQQLNLPHVQGYVRMVLALEWDFGVPCFASLCIPTVQGGVSVNLLLLLHKTFLLKEGASVMDVWLLGPPRRAIEAVLCCWSCLKGMELTRSGVALNVRPPKDNYSPVSCVPCTVIPSVTKLGGSSFPLRRQKSRARRMGLVGCPQRLTATLTLYTHT